MTKVKTVYNKRSFRDPDISEYSTRKEAESMVEITLKWGIGIVSCEIVEEE